MEVLVLLSRYIGKQNSHSEFFKSPFHLEESLSDVLLISFSFHFYKVNLASKHFLAYFVRFIIISLNDGQRGKINQIQTRKFPQAMAIRTTHKFFSVQNCCLQPTYWDGTSFLIMFSMLHGYL